MWKNLQKYLIKMTLEELKNEALKIKGAFIRDSVTNEAEGDLFIGIIEHLANIVQTSGTDNWFYMDKNNIVHCRFDFLGDYGVGAIGDGSAGEESAPVLANNIRVGAWIIKEENGELIITKNGVAKAKINDNGVTNI